jgi:hypothetical protein
MSRTETLTATLAVAEKTDTREALRTPVEIAAEVATVLAGMTHEERVRAYRSAALSVHELHVAAAWFPERMPLLNGELEWIAIDLE